MKQISDYKEVSPLVLKYFKRGVITNNFLTSEDYKCEIEEGRLFYNSGEDYLNIYLKRDKFFQLYFYALNDSVRFPEIGEKLVCDASEKLCKVIEKNGFKKIMQRVRLELKVQKQENTMSGNKAEKRDSEEIFDLMQKSFDKYTGYIPNFTQVKKECENGLFLKSEEQGIITGALRFGVSGKTAQIKHLCVKEEFRGKGIGRNLCNTFLKENEKYVVWTGKENIGALNLYKSLGFSENGSESTVYMKG